MKKPYEQIKIDVSKLRLDILNPRFVEVFNKNSTEDEVIEYLIYHEKAIDIVRKIDKLGHFYDDSNPWVVENNDGTYTVKEGNRRLASVKSLLNPEKYLKSKFQKMNISELQCLVYKDIKALDDRILERHTQLEISGWTKLAQAVKVKNHYDTYKDLNITFLKSPKTLLQLFYFYKEVYSFNQDILKLLEEDNRASVFERLFSPNISKRLGFYFNKKNEIIINSQDTFRNFINRFFELFARNDIKITTRTLNTVSEANSFIDEFLSDIAINVVNAKETDKQNTLFNNKKDSENKKPVEKPIIEKVKKQKKLLIKKENANTFIPNTEINYINHDFKKVYNLFYELQTINVYDNPVCVSAGIRCLLEYTCKAYYKIIEEKKEYDDKDDAIHSKIGSIVSKLEKKGYLTSKAKNLINRNLGDAKSNIGTNHLNDMMHGLDYTPQPIDIIKSWEIIKVFIEPVWEEINKNI